MTGQFIVVAIGIACGFLMGGLISFLADLLPGMRGVEEREAGSWRWLRTVREFGQSWRKELGVAGIVVQSLIPSIVLTVAFIYVQQVSYDLLASMLMTLLVVFGMLVSMIDVKYHLILLPVNVVGALVGVVLGALRYGFFATVFGGVVNFATLLLFYWLGKRIGHFAEKASDGAPMGFGDVLYSGVLGFYLGFPLSYIGLMAGSAVGLLFVLGELGRAALTRTERRPIPYGPALTIGAVLVMVLMG